MTYIPLKMRRGLAAEGQVILDELLAPSSACTIPRALTPSETSTIELYKPLAACDDNNAPPILSTPVHVIKTDHHESAKRELQKHEETKPSGCGTVGNPPCQTVWYRTIPNDPVWSHYFSEQVKIGPVRISKYKKDQSGRLTFIEKVRPSRIVIISNFQGTSALNPSGDLAGDGNRCYAIPEAQITGDQPYIDLSLCHPSSPDQTGFSTTRDITATPNYFDDADNMTDNNAPTWFMEFNDVGSEASPPPSLGADEILFIEFEIIPG